MVSLSICQCMLDSFQRFMRGSFAVDLSLFVAMAAAVVSDFTCVRMQDCDKKSC